MHVYLITTRDYKEAFVYSNLKIATEKCKDIDGIAYEWMELWCRPLIYDSRTNNDDVVFDDTSLPWEMLKLAYQQEQWNARVMYREEQFDSNIKSRTK